MITGLRAGLHCGPPGSSCLGDDASVITGLRAGLHCGDVSDRSVRVDVDAVITGLRAGLHCGPWPAAGAGMLTA